MSRCLIIAGPNGAGKTTFARKFLPADAIKCFINTDLIAAGLSPLDPSAAQVAAGRVFLDQLDRVSRARADFAFESTLSGLTYIARLRRLKAAGYTIEIIYLKLDDIKISLERIAARVRSGGQQRSRSGCPPQVRAKLEQFSNALPSSRRLQLGIRCEWARTCPRFLRTMKPPSHKPKRRTANPRAAKILKSLRDARKEAIKTARLHRTPIVYLQDAKLVKERP